MAKPRARDANGDFEGSASCDDLHQGRRVILRWSIGGTVRDQAQQFGTVEEAESSTGWQADIPGGTSVKLVPDPHIMDAIGGNHRLETAVADLVDNSIDAGASRVLIRFVIADRRIQTFYVVDDGKGMTREEIDRAMTVGGARAYGSTELGHFGLGLKAASFSQADSLTVISNAEASAAVGRRWLASKASASFECDVVGYGFACRELIRPWGFVVPQPGTIVRWDQIRGFPAANEAGVASRFVQDATTRLQHHLGMVFHRFLDQGKIRIGIDVEDVSLLGTGPVLEVKALDPFGYPRSGAGGYPKLLIGSVQGELLDVKCHVWSGRSQLPQFRLPGGTPEHRQGFYFYRRDRLLQAGGWNNVEISRRDLQLARVEINLPDALAVGHGFRMNPEKTKVETGHDFEEAVKRATSNDDGTFQSYLDSAVEAFKHSNQRSRTRAPIVPLGRGVPRRLRQAVHRELEALPGREEVSLRWRDFDDGMLFDIDREESTIWLNNQYRKTITGDGRGAFNDAPLVKTLLFLLTENLFHGAYLGPKDKDNLELWQAVMTAAAREELE